MKNIEGREYWLNETVMLFLEYIELGEPLPLELVDLFRRINDRQMHALGNTTYKTPPPPKASRGGSRNNVSPLS